MAFSFANVASASPGFGSPSSQAGGVHVEDGPDLQEIQTNELGFSAVNGESKVQVLPKPWPQDALPSPSSSLLSIASSRGLLAAGGPEAIYLTSTTKLRDAFRGDQTSQASKIRGYEPEIEISLPRPTHVVFSADERVLVAASQSEARVVAFQVDRLQQGQLTPALSISTSGQSLRALAPNPAPDLAELFALVTANGELMLLDLKTGSFTPGREGPVLKNNVSCISWSNRGKQLVAGLADGTVSQLKPDGSIAASIPRSTSISPNSHVSGISWLENDSFFIAYTPNAQDDGILPSEYYIVNREPKTTNYTFQKLPEILLPFGLERLPSSHFIARLRNFPPHIQDLLIVTATTSTDVGIVSKADKPLSDDDPVINAFTFTNIENDGRRAQLPLTRDLADTSPIGMAIDLSSKESVLNPIPSDVEILETPGPVPNLTILNNDGVLVSWWLIYNDSIREKTAFSGFANFRSEQSEATIQQPAPVATPPSTTFGQTPTTNTNSSVTPTSTFGQPGFGAGTNNPLAKSPLVPGDKPSWASAGFSASQTSSGGSQAFGKPSFGSATPMGAGSTPAFGSATAMGSSSGFGKPSFGATTPAFGQPSAFGSASAASPFASSASASKPSGFSSFSQGGGFASFASEGTESKAASPFGQAGNTGGFGTRPSSSPFGGNKDTASPFNQIPSSNGFGSGASPFAQGTSDAKFRVAGASFGSTKPAGANNVFGGASSFKLESSFKGDGTAKDDLPRPSQPSGLSFGTSFNDMLGDAKKPLSPTHDKEEEMDDETAGSEDDSDTYDRAGVQVGAQRSTTDTAPNLVTPPGTLSQPKVTPAPPVSNLFSNTAAPSTTPQTTAPGWSFGSLPSTTPKETPASHLTMFGPKSQTAKGPAVVEKSERAKVLDETNHSPHIKEEAPSDDEAVDLENVPEAPLPPDPISKPHYTAGDTSVSSIASKTPSDDAPLPPEDFAKPPLPKTDASQQGLPGEDDSDLGSSFDETEGPASERGSPVEEPAEEQVQTSPESSFKGGDHSPQESPTGGLFTKVSTANLGQKVSRPLFGEVGNGPIFAPPKPHESPRSPSPVRKVAPHGEGLRVDAARSVSAPQPRSMIEQRKTEYQQSAIAAEAGRLREAESAKAKARREDLARQKAAAEAAQLESLQDDEDERLRKELEHPVTPSQDLDELVTYQPKPFEESGKTGVPAQIERLYADINSMVYTLGINSRSLKAFMLYQQPEAVNQSWPSVLRSDTPLDALNDEWYLSDINRLHEGLDVITHLLEESQVHNVEDKLHQCQVLLGRDLYDLRTKLTSIRKQLHAITSNEQSVAVPLSSEQAMIQHDLRKISASVQTKLVQVEDNLAVLRAKLAASGESKRGAKKPTVEAVTNTIAKMMNMVEQKSADIDVLEAQLKKINISMKPSSISNGDDRDGQSTPHNRSVTAPRTPVSTAGSVYHTPDSKFGGSMRSQRSFRSSQSGGLSAVTEQDKEHWRARLRRRKDVAGMLKGILEERRTKALAAA